MNLCISNIAWKREENRQALELIKSKRIDSIDIAPTLIFDHINDLTSIDILKQHEIYQKIGMKIIGMQSLLFGNDSSIFDGHTQRELIFKYLQKDFLIAKGLGIKNLVFGSPKNRFINKNNESIMDIVVSFFKKICDEAYKSDLNICLEANPKEYGCNFITDTFQAIDFIKNVGSKNLFLNFDTSTIIINKNDFEKVLSISFEFIKHVHISSPYLLGIKELDHGLIHGLLKKYNYQGYVSLEMKQNITEDNLKYLEENIMIFINNYQK